MPFPSLLKRTSPYAILSPRFVPAGVSAVFSPVFVSTSHRYDSFSEISSFNRILESSGDQSSGPQPPPSNFVSTRSLFGSDGLITHKSVSFPVRRVDIYAIWSPPKDHGPHQIPRFPIRQQ